MAQLQPLPRDELLKIKAFAAIAEIMGFVSNSLLTMGRKPELLQAFSALNVQVFGPGRVDERLKWLIGFVSSNAAGCRYCQAHTSELAHGSGVAIDKIRAAFEYETSPLFNAAERAALRLAHHASLVPNLSTSEHFDDLKQHYGEAEIVEIVAVIAMFGFLNRWNDTMGTQLEPKPREFASEILGAKGWIVGKHD
ncbi:MAG: carboxymuconolactone decarboxylase family protein [Planctomycetes bacterium]|nr:carboxymuconolactone decarboxylase family protein [Planctomycetota bacterium]